MIVYYMSENLVRRNRTSYHKQYYETNKEKIKKQRNTRVKKLRKAAGLVPCQCGCNKLIPALTFNLEPARFASGHNSRKRERKEEG